MTTLGSNPGFSDPKGFSVTPILLGSLPGEVLALAVKAVVQVSPSLLSKNEQVTELTSGNLVRDRSRVVTAPLKAVGMFRGRGKKIWLQESCLQKYSVG